MDSQTTDFQILTDVFYEYVLGVSEIRRMIMPAIFVMIFSRYLQVSVSTLIKVVSSSLKTGTGLGLSLIIYSLVAISSTIFVEVSSFYVCKAGQIAFRIANRNAYKYFLDLPPKDYISLGKGEIQNIINRKSSAVRDIVDVISLQMVPISLTILFASIEIVSNLGFFPLLIILSSLILYAVTTIKITIWRNSIRERLNRTTDTSTNVLVDGLSNYETIFTCNTDSAEIERYDRSLKTVQKRNLEITQSLYLLNLSQGLIWELQAVLVLSVLSYGLLTPAIDPSNFNYFLSITATFQASMFNLGGVYGKYKAGMLNIRMASLPVREKHGEGFRTMHTFHSRFLVENLSFSYKNKLILNQVHFEIKKGEKVAVVGKNGVGKSTLIKSLVGLNDSNFRMFFDQISSDELSDDSLKHMYSYVPQNAILFNESITYNIKYGNPKIFDEQIYSLSKILGFHESFIKLENGYNTICGENGASLSGGERQKIFILRALLRETPMLIMDEPTASLDKNSEYNVLQTITAMKSLTVLAIVHNLYLLNLFDKILLIEDKKVKLILPEEFKRRSILK